MTKYSEPEEGMEKVAARVEEMAKQGVPIVDISGEGLASPESEVQTAGEAAALQAARNLAVRRTEAAREWLTRWNQEHLMEHDTSTEADRLTAFAASETARADAAEADTNDEIRRTAEILRVMNEETVIAGFPGGDRYRTLANIRAMAAALATARNALQDIQEISSGRVGKPPTYATLREIYDAARAALNPPTQEKTTE